MICAKKHIEIKREVSCKHFYGAKSFDYLLLPFKRKEFANKKSFYGFESTGENLISLWFEPAEFLHIKIVSVSRLMKWKNIKCCTMLCWMFYSNVFLFAHWWKLFLRFFCWKLFEYFWIFLKKTNFNVCFLYL